MSDQNTTAQGSFFSPRLALWCGGLLVLGLVFHQFIWGVIRALLANVVPLLFTPFILELSVGFVGLFIVLTFCHFRQKKHEDEWVYISQVEPENEMEQIPEPLRRRVGETVMKDRPEQLDAAVLKLEPIEGLIELGLFDEALAELAKLPAAAQRTTEVKLLQMSALLRDRQWEDAMKFARANPSPIRLADQLAQTCVEVAKSFVKKKPAENDAASECLEVGKSLSLTVIVEAMEIDRKLRKLG